MLSTGSDQQGQNIRVRTVFLTLTKILDLLVFFHQVCKKYISYFRHIHRQIIITVKALRFILGSRSISSVADKYTWILMVFFIVVIKKFEISFNVVRDMLSSGLRWVGM